jgi:bifunctional UDP-N-acetylglucosamine pyrophosphorylase/glucosamine-1-phosphate N-acetyltransferase
MSQSSPEAQALPSNIQCIILAAGQGTRMKSDQPKVLHTIADRPMIDYVIDAAQTISALPPIVVVGYGSERVQAAIGDRVVYVLQSDQRGTGHAVRQARDRVAAGVDTVIVLYGDTPFIGAPTLQQLLLTHSTAHAALTLITFKPADPADYGRIVRDAGGDVTAIVEYKEATPHQRRIDEVNSGLMCCEAQWLWTQLPQLQPRPGHGELYLTDLVESAAKAGQIIATHEANELEVLGINDRIDLAHAEQIMRDRINRHWLLEGVTLIDPTRTYIGSQVSLGSDTVIYSGTHLQGQTAIGRECRIGPDAIIRDSRLGDRCRITASMLEGATLEDEVDVGPYSHLRQGAYLCRGVHIGNFAEVKNSRLGPGTKQGHMSYLGDATIGANVNIGAGTITCNFDGERKWPTEIGDDTFIGSDTMLVAPLKIGKGARTGAGSVVTHDVADGELVYGVPARKPEKKVD